MGGKNSVISLNGTWEYEIDEKNTGEKEKYFMERKFSSSMKIPASWQLAGVEDYCGVIWFRRNFKLPEDIKENQIWLRFKGVDYYTDVWVNGQYVGNHEGYFQSFEFNITEYVNWGKENNLVVKVNSPLEEPGKVWPAKKYLIKGIFNNSDFRPGSWSLKHGQDKGTGGIWNDVDILIKNDARVRSIKVSPTLVPDGSAIARADIQIDNLNPDLKKARLKAVIRPANFSSGKEYVVEKEVELAAGKNDITIVKEVKNPELWWSWEHGDQNLYYLEVSLTDDDKVIDFESVRFGFREIKIDSQWNWYLNGRQIFIKGTMVIPTQWLSEYDDQMIAKDIKLLRGANINMALPACHINRDEFYQACDEAGILVYQDFPLMWSYEESDRFRENAVRQVKDMVNLFYNHPSIALWCCQREATVNQYTLDPVLRDAAAEEDPTRLVIANSDFTEHAYYGWYFGTYQQFDSLPGAPFVSEFGAQALPNLETMKKMFEPDDLWPPNWEKWAYHDFQHEQCFHVAKVDMGDSIEEFIENSQQHQYNVLKYAIETYRKNKFDKIKGISFLGLVDCWPSITWSIVDYYRNPKKAYYAVKTAYQPVLVTADFGTRELVQGAARIFNSIWIVNDLFDEFKNAKVEVSLEDTGSKKIISDEFKVDIKPNSSSKILDRDYSKSTKWVIPSDLKPGRYLIKARVLASDGATLSTNQYEIDIYPAVARVSSSLVPED